MTAAAITVAQGELILPEPVGKQWEWLDSPASRKVLRVGRRGTKTRFAFTAGMMGHGPGWEEDNPRFGGILQGGDVVWICPTYANLTTVLWREEIVPRMGHLPWVNLDKSLHDVNIPGLGSLMLRSGDREAIDNVRGIGKRLKGVIVDEAAHMDSRGALLDVILPALMDNGGWLILMSTTNAGSDGGYDDTGAPQMPSYFNQICEEWDAGKRGPEWQVFYATAYDNPTLPKEAIDELIAEYPPDSPKLKQEVFAELLTTGVGLALPGLSEKTHMVSAFQPEEHWSQFCAFDWGFHHPWSFGRYCVDEDGQVYKRDTVTGRMDLPEAIDQKARRAGFDPKATLVFAGGDIWRVRMKKGEFAGPTIAEELMNLGWRLVAANDARVAGLNNLRRYTFIDPAKQDARPRFLWMDTPGNRLCLAQVARMPLDPENPEDALKVDADSAGRGGDDTYDETRYGLMSRPIAAKLPPSPPYKVAHVARRLTVKDGKLVPFEPEPTNLEEMDQWAAKRRNTQRTVIPSRPRVPTR
jgi:hypothetical protein